MFGRLAIIVIAAVGLYAVVSSMRGPDEMATEPMLTATSASQDSMKKDKMVSKKPRLTREQETRQLLAELKTIPVSEYAVNKMKYERLLELHPGNETFMRKVDFYAGKLQTSRTRY